MSAAAAAARARRERPLIFTAESMRGLLDGSKTQTRRLVKDAPADTYEVVSSLLADHGDLWEFRCRGERGMEHHPIAIRCPYGSPGDRIWCKESYALAPACNDPDPEDQDDWSVVYRSDSDGRPWLSSLDENAVEVKPPWRSPLFMPRWASRLTLELVEVRVQRLQEISEADAIAEGVTFTDYGHHEHRISADGGATWGITRTRRAGWFYGPSTRSEQCFGSARMAYASAWESLNGKRRRREYLRRGDPRCKPGRPWRTVVDTSASWDANPFVWALTVRRLS